MKKIPDRWWVLVCGLLAQLCLYGAMPLLVRIYPSEAVADWSLVLTWINLIWSFSQLKTDVALVQVADEDTRRQLYGLGFWSNVMITCILALLIYFSGGRSAQISAGWLAPVLLAHGLHQMNQGWFLSTHAFRVLGWLRLMQAVLAYLPALAGMYIWGPSGMLWTLLWSNVAVGGFALILPGGPGVPLAPGWKASKDLFKKFKSVFTYLAAGNMLLSIAEQAMVLIIARFYDPVLAAAYFMAARICNLPLSLMQSALSQYNLRWFQDMRNKGVFVPLVLFKFWIRLFLPGSLFFLPIILWGPQIFSWILGQNWDFAGKLARVFAILAWIRFVNNPTSMGYFVMGHSERFFYFTLLFLLGAGISTGMAASGFSLMAVVRFSVLFQVLLLIAYNLGMLRLMRQF